ncbi:hypothetical protein M8818_002319 [Zalaria obscura]|uniref:Uncharacterized protein n=1 Tax=Zalaria obscura TaxID=2024903 RepID=A0ACC3SI26_9PEZI
MKKGRILTHSQNTSTLQSYVDQASGYVQSAVGSLTGNSADKSQAEQKKTEAAAKDDLSHAGTNVGPFSVSTSGVAVNDERRTQGSWDQTLGSGKEMVGNLVGAEGLKQEGIKQNQAGKGTEAEGQISDLGKGISDRVTGTVGGAVAGLTGNTEEQKKREAQHDTGKTQQRGVEADLDKQANA